MTKPKPKKFHIEASKLYFTEKYTQVLLENIHKDFKAFGEVQDDHGRKIDRLIDDVDVLKEGMKTVKMELAVVRSDIKVLQTDVKELKEQVANLEEAVKAIPEMQTDIAQMKKDIADIKGRLEDNAIQEEEFIALKRRVAYLETLVLKPSAA